MSLEWHENFAGMAFLAAALEEGAKLLAVLAIAVAFRRHFHDPLDGLIYGATIGLGAAVCESAFYLSLYGGGAETLGGEAIRLILHLLMGGLGGFGLGVLFCRPPRWAIVAPWALLGAFGLHFLWDFLCGLPAAIGSATGREQTFAAILLLAGLVGFGTCAVLGHRWSKQLFAPDCKRSLWGWPFVKE